MTIEATAKSPVIEAKGTCSVPELDLAAIKARAEDLDPKSQTKADIYLLLIEVERLRKG